GLWVWRWAGFARYGHTLSYRAAICRAIRCETVRMDDARVTVCDRGANTQRDGRRPCRWPASRRTPSWGRRTGTRGGEGPSPSPRTRVRSTARRRASVGLAAAVPARTTADAPA